MPTIDATVASDESYTLGEGPVWDGARGRLLWVDIGGGTVQEGALDDRWVRVTATHAMGEPATAVAAGADGCLLVTLERRLVIIRPDGVHEDGPVVMADDAGRRFNDAATDPAGRLVMGTLSLQGPSETEELMRLELDGRITPIDRDLQLSNGLAWSADGRTMYTVDTGRHTVFARSYDPDSGAVGVRRTHLVVDDGSPDGITMDADEHLWVAVWGAGEVRRCSPGGEVVDRIRVPAPHSSSVAFAGDDLRTIVITTARVGLDDETLRANPLSGRLFTAHAQVPGLPVPPWAGWRRRRWFARRWRS